MAFPVGAVITIREGQEVGKGDVLARIPQASSKTRDITGGLPRVAELLKHACRKMPACWLKLLVPFPSVKKPKVNSV